MHEMPDYDESGRKARPDVSTPALRNTMSSALTSWQMPPMSEVITMCSISLPRSFPPHFRGPLDTFSLFMDPCLQFKGVVFRLVIAVTVDARVREEFSALLTQHA